MSRITWIAAAVAGLSLSLPAASAGEAAGTPCPCQGAAAAAAGATVDGTVVAGASEGASVAGSTAAVAGGSATSGPVHHYSYYIDFPAPSRTYVPYGPTDVFSYRGQAYGHAYDRWTWPAMSGASAGVGRYYQILR